MKNSENISWVYWLSILLLAPALLINLGMLTYIDDEAIRALVALEMDLSGNYIVPTMNGAFYYNKPPLYNWILLLYFKAFGEYSEFVSRFATVVHLLGYAATVFYFFRKHFSIKVAFLNAFILITCGRILFFDSFLGLIDIMFSWVTFTVFMLIYQYGEREQYYKLFLSAYFLTALAFLMKGLPSVVFLGFTLLAYFIYKKEFKHLFSLPHILGGLLFLGIVGGYYLVYHQYNDLTEIFTRLFTESSKRTVVSHAIWDTILHLFKFPLESVYNFLPWSLMIIYFFRKGAFDWIKQNEFIKYCLLIFAVNIPLYWASPGIYPRYLFMHAPLIFGAYVYLHYQHRAANSWQYRVINGFLFVVVVIALLGSLVPLFLPQTAATAYLYLKCAALFSLTAFLAWHFYKNIDNRLVFVIPILLIARVGFNWFVTPDRLANDYGDKVRTSSINIGQKYPNTYILYTGLQPTNNFYITNETQRILKKSSKLTKGDTVIINHKRPELIEPLDSILLRYERRVLPVGVVK